jgi:hypothetical protein
MPQGTTSHFRFGFRSLDETASASEYSKSYSGGRLMPGRVSLSQMTRSNPITLSDDHVSLKIPRSTTHDAYTAHEINDTRTNESKKTRTESHFIMGYVHGPFVDSEYSAKFKSVGFPINPPSSKNHRTLDSRPFFSTECEQTDYTSESKRAFTMSPGYSNLPIHHSSSHAKLRGSNFSLGSASVDPVTLSTSHSHYAKRSGLGKQRKDPEIIAIKEELSKSHFSLCD